MGLEWSLVDDARAETFDLGKWSELRAELLIGGENLSQYPFCVREDLTAPVILEACRRIMGHVEGTYYARAATRLWKFYSERLCILRIVDDCGDDPSYEYDETGSVYDR